MIQEIINFVETLPDEVFTHNLKPKEGLYVLLDIDKNGNLINTDKNGNINSDDVSFYFKSDNELTPLIEKCLPLWVNTVPVSNAKIFNPIKKVFGNTCSPFAFSFNKKNWEKYEEQKLLQKQFKDSVVSKENISDRFREFMRGELKIYFDIAGQYVENDKQNQNLLVFKNFLHNNIFDLVNNLKEFKTLNSAQGIYFFQKNLPIEDFKEPYENYLAAKVFNKEDYNKEKKSTQEIFGISDSVSYFNNKKPFLKHFTAPLEYNYRINGKEATRIWQFYNLQRNKQIPNPMPVFIDKQELTEMAVKIFNEEKGKLGYVELVKKLISPPYSEDLSNYYLLYFDVRAKKSKIADIDFVSNFRYEMKDVKIIEIFSLGGSLEAKTKVKNVFDFEYKILNEIFNRQLMPKHNWRRYFDEIEAHKMSANTYNQLMKYRKSIYDFVFKSQRKAITKNMFDDIILKGILDDIRLDDDRSNDYSIKVKLNIWFSLYEYFEYTQFDKSLKNESMINKTKNLIERISTIATNENEHLQNDNEFAFAVGQIIYYLLNKSEASNRTHALLEPFLQKTHSTLLKKEIAKCFDNYKHAIKFYARKYEFDKVMSEVMGFEPVEKNMKNLLPQTLAGYFAKSTFDKKTEK